MLMVTVTLDTFQIGIVRYTNKVKIGKYLERALFANKQNLFPKASSNLRHPLLCV